MLHWGKYIVSFLCYIPFDDFFFLVPPSVSKGKLVFFLLLLFNHNYSKNGSPSIIHVYTTMLLRALSTNSVSSFITFLHNIVLWAISFPKSVLFSLNTVFENAACQHAAALRPRRTATFVWIGLHLETLGCSKCGTPSIEDQNDLRKHQQYSLLHTYIFMDRKNEISKKIYENWYRKKLNVWKSQWKITKHM